MKLGLGTPYNDDGWGRGYNINVEARTLFSSGPDGIAGTASDNIPAGVEP